MGSNTRTKFLHMLGPAGTNGHIAGRIAEERLLNDSFTREVRSSFEKSHTEVFFRLIEARGCQHIGVVAIENTIEGLVREVIAHWLSVPSGRVAHPITGEIHLPINHVLLVRQGYERVSLRGIQVLSHPQALGQCRKNIARLGLGDTVFTKSTAEAASLVGIRPEYAGCAAIASPLAAKITPGVAVVKEHMEDDRRNTTRFHIIGGCRPMPTGKDRTAMICWTKDVPGALLGMLAAISNEGVNLSSIHSLPLGIPGKYAFYLEFDEHLDSPTGKRIHAGLRKVTSGRRILGSYPRQERRSS